MKNIKIIFLVFSLLFMQELQASSEEELMKLRQASVVIQEKIAANWHPTVSSSSRSAVGAFEVNEDGSIANLKMKKKSGNYDFDVKCLKTIIDSAPFNPISRWIAIEFDFDYNLYQKKLFGKEAVAREEYDPNHPYSLELYEKSVPVIVRKPDHNSTTATQVISKANLVNSQNPSPSNALTDADMKKIASFKLVHPLDCQLNKDCFATIYPEHAGTEKDYACGRLSTTNMDGTSFSLRNSSLINNPGVKVLAVANGEVLEINNGYDDDYSFSQSNSIDSCGNSLSIKHDNDFTTSYCHLMKDSIIVKPRQKLSKGDVLAKLGASGDTNQPQLYMQLKYKSKVIDPFTGTGLETPCSEAGKNYKKSLWQDHISYKSTGLRDVGIADSELLLEDVWANKFPGNSIASDAKALIFWVHFFGQEKGDIEDAKIFDPDGKLFFTGNTVLDKDYRDSLRYAGRLRTGEAFKKGKWKASYKLQRESATVFETSYEFFVK